MCFEEILYSEIAGIIGKSSKQISGDLLAVRRLKQTEILPQRSTLITLPAISSVIIIKQAIQKVSFLITDRLLFMYL